MSIRIIPVRCLVALISSLGTGWVLLTDVASTHHQVLAQDEREPTSRGTEFNTPLLGDYLAPMGLNPIVIEGVGLVTGLNGTGGDPAPSIYRSTLMNEMKRLGVRNPNAWLRSPNTALVLVRAYLPPALKPGDTLDAEVVIPDSAEATSLVGGWLLETVLREHAVGGGQLLEGHIFAKARGSILVPGALGEHTMRNSRDITLRRGRILGGVTVTRKRELAIYLRNEYRSVRNAARIAEVIGRRFHHYDEHGSKLPMAKALTDQKLVLEIHPRYKDNYLRYMQVIRHLAFRETPLNQRLRVQRLHEELFIPEHCERAALQLEGIGKDAIPILKTALKAPLVECRFHAAMALAYLEQSEAIPILQAVIREEPAFRVFALAALSTLDDAQAHMALRELMNESSAETRYGAFRALWTLDRQDPFIRGLPMGRSHVDDPAGTEDRGLWYLHVLDTSGDPMIHCTLRARPEIVLFGTLHKLETPLALTVGQRIVVSAQAGEEKISVVRFELNKPDVRREIPLDLARLIITVDELGATYPEIVSMLVQAARQRNLPGRLETDALPRAGRLYERPATELNPARKTRVGQEQHPPNLFPSFDDEDDVWSDKSAAETAHAEPSSTTRGGMASIDERGDSQESRESKPSRSWWNWWSKNRNQKASR